MSDIEARLSASLQGKPRPTPTKNVKTQKEEVVEPKEDKVVADLENELGDDSNEDFIEVETYKVGDEDLTLDDLIKGNMLQKDYTSKTQKLSEERKDFDAKKSALESKLEDARTMLESEIDDLNDPDFRQLQQSNPDRYWREVDRVRSKVEKFNKLKDSQQAEQEAKEQALIQKEQKALASKMPEWADKEVFNKEKDALQKTLSDAGYEEGDISSIKDHRIFVLARQAMKLQEMLNAKPNMKKVAVTGKVNQTVKTEKTNSDSTKHRDQLKSSGKLNDAAKAISSLLNKK